MPSQAEEAWLADALGGAVREFFTEIGVDLGPGDTNVMVSCFANPAQHRNDDHVKSCSVSLGSGVWNCKGCGVKGNAFQAAKAKGYQDKDARRIAERFGLFEKGKVGPSLPGERQIKRWVQDMQNNPAVLRRCWEVKGWSPQAIRRLQLGWDGGRITFPVRDERLRITGVVRYLPGAEQKTLAMAGTKRGLFPAPEIVHRRHTLFVVEGEPDAVSLWTAGVRAVGVPGASAWKPEWAKRLWGRNVVVLADCDVPGREVARQVARSLAKERVRVVDLDSGRDDGYDVGDLVCEAGAGGLRGLHDWFEALSVQSFGVPQMEMSA